MDSKLQPVQLYGFSKSRLYEPLGTAIFFRNRFCPVSWILVFLPVHFYGYSLVFPVPNKEVQAQIVQTLRGLDSRILDAIDMLDGLQFLKRGLMQQLFI